MTVQWHYSVLYNVFIYSAQNYLWSIHVCDTNALMPLTVIRGLKYASKRKTGQDNGQNSTSHKTERLCRHLIVRYASKTRRWKVWRPKGTHVFCICTAIGPVRVRRGPSMSDGRHLTVILFIIKMNTLFYYPWETINELTDYLYQPFFGQTCQTPLHTWRDANSTTTPHQVITTTYFTPALGSSLKYLHFYV